VIKPAPFILSAEAISPPPLARPEPAIAIITARGGSKRIPRKNVRLFSGRPIIEYSIAAARASGLFQVVMVSTDDDEIAEVAQKAGAAVPFRRSAATSTDHATTADVLVEVLDEYQRRGTTWPTACCLYATAPFITAEKLRRASALLAERQADAVIPVTAFSFPIWRSFKVEQGHLAFNWPENALRRSQDLPPAYHDCGQFYFFRTASFRAQGTLVMDQTVPLVMPGTEVQDIDNEEDWELAELKFSFLARRTE
jgi:N-acylneuraminate cytidylyltransferase